MDDETLGRAYRQSLSNAGVHLTEAEWTALQLNELATADRNRLLAHVVSCAECTAIHRSLLTLAAEAPAFDREVPSNAASRSRSTWYWAAGLAAAAILVIGVRINRAPGADATQDVVRNSSTVAVIETTSPRAGRPLANRRIEWSAVTSAAQYEVRISSTDGGTVWQSQVAATATDVPSSVALRGHYYVQITALRDGAVIGSSPLVPFDVD